MAARKAVDQELSRNKILEAARAIFVEKGYQQASMRQLSQKLGYSHGAIYYHFKNKAELFYALVRQDFSLLDEKLDVILAENEIDQQKKLENVLKGFIEFGMRNQSHYEIMFMIKEEELNTYREQEPNKSYEKFANAIFELTNKNIGITQIWSVFLSLHGFVSHYCKSGQTYEDVEGLAHAHVQFILKGIK